LYAIRGSNSPACNSTRIQLNVEKDHRAVTVDHSKA
jgi:hypothetical protein